MTKKCNEYDIRTILHWSLSRVDQSKFNWNKYYEEVISDCSIRYLRNYTRKINSNH